MEKPMRSRNRVMKTDFKADFDLVDMGCVEVFCESGIDMVSLRIVV